MNYKHTLVVITCLATFPMPSFSKDSTSLDLSFWDHLPLSADKTALRRDPKWTRPLKGLKDVQVRAIVSSHFALGAHLSDVQKGLSKTSADGVEKDLSAQLSQLTMDGLSNAGLVVSPIDVVSFKNFYSIPQIRVNVYYAPGPGLSQGDDPDSGLSTEKDRIEYSAVLELCQVLTLDRDSDLSFLMPTWKIEEKGLCQSPVQIKSIVSNLVNSFISDWMAANPQRPAVSTGNRPSK